mmetsp:Transcript_40329/g.66989  ORF Transcript_40329/g.66989 Transcript_40329/m.66989 type:complete len:306 (+) Transcript_40329:81-998(+)
MGDDYSIATKFKVVPDIFAEAPQNKLKHGESYTMTVGDRELTFVPESFFAPKIIISLASINSVEKFQPPYSAACMLIKLDDESYEKVWVPGETMVLEAAIDKIQAMCKLLTGDIVVCGSLDPITGKSVTFFDPKVSGEFFSSTYRLILANVDTIEKVPLGSDLAAGYIQVKRTTAGVVCSVMTPAFEEEFKQTPCFCATTQSSELVLDVSKMTSPSGTTYDLLKPGETVATTPLTIPIKSQDILAAPVLPGFKLVPLPKMPENKSRSTSTEGRKSLAKRFPSISRKGGPEPKIEDAAEQDATGTV